MGVKQVVSAGNAQLCVLERLLFIRWSLLHLYLMVPLRPEDVEIAVERAEGTAT